MTSVATITHSTGAITPATLDGYRASRAAGTRVHPISTRSEPDYTLRPFGLRTGSFRLVFADAAAADTAMAALCTPQTLTLTSTVRAGINMTFIIPEGTSPEIAPGTAGETTIALDFQEVLS